MCPFPISPHFDFCYILHFKKILQSKLINSLWPQEPSAGNHCLKLYIPQEKQFLWSEVLRGLHFLSFPGLYIPGVLLCTRNLTSFLSWPGTWFVWPGGAKNSTWTLLKGLTNRRTRFIFEKIMISFHLIYGKRLFLEDDVLKHIWCTSPYPFLSKIKWK